MATELDTRIWLMQKAYSTRDLFVKMLETVEESEICSGKFSNLSVYENIPSNKVLSKNEEHNSTELKEILASFNSEAFKFTIYVPLCCWRFSGYAATQSNIQLAISCWGSEFGRSIGLDIFYEGNAQLSVLSVGPFCELINDTSTLALAVNSKVEENNESFINLLLCIVKVLTPKKMMTFSDAGAYIPINAHIAYYNSKDEIIQDYVWLKETLISGNVTYTIPSLLDGRFESDFNILHEWRTQISKEKLSMELFKIIKSSCISRERISSVLKSGKIDSFENGDAVMILDYPFFANNFLDEFFLDLVTEN